MMSYGQSPLLLYRSVPVPGPPSVLFQHANMALLWLLVVGLLAVLVLYLNIPAAIYTYYKCLQASRQFPGLPTHWFWGNAKQLAAIGFHKWYELTLGFVQKGRYKLSRSWFGPFTLELEIIHPDSLKHILKEPKVNPCIVCCDRG